MSNKRSWKEKKKKKQKLRKNFKLVKLASMKNRTIDYAIFLFMFIFMILSLAGINYIITIIREYKWVIKPEFANYVKIQKG